MQFIKRNSTKILVFLATLGLAAAYIFRLPDYFKFNPEGQFLALKLQDLLTLFLGIIVEAFPFVILGVVVSVLVGIFVDEEWVLKRLPKNRIISHVIISLLGVLMPVCECGNIPVARRLLLKGFTVSQSITFLLAAPILNPVTFITTREAFYFAPEVVWIRMIAGFIIANFIGILLSFKSNQSELLTQEFYAEVCEADHHHHDSKIEEALEIFQNEFLEIMKVLVIGAALAAISQTFIPRDIILLIGQNPIMSIIAMLILAFVISICSNVDAFFALSYANTFTLGSIMTFLVFGPMIDIKILTMMKSTFKLKTLLLITVLVTMMSVLVGLMVNFFI